jgi:hypothetical protein
MKWAGHAARRGEMKNSYKIFVGNPEGKRLLREPSCRWEGNIRMDVRRIWWKSVDWIHLPLDRNQWRVIVNTVMNLRVP